VDARSRRGRAEKQPDSPRPARTCSATKVGSSLTLTRKNTRRCSRRGRFGFPGGGFPGAPDAAEGRAKPGEVKRETHRSAFGMEFPWASRRSHAEGKTIEKVGLRYKGNSTYGATARNLKRSLKVDIDRHDEAARSTG